MAIWRVLVVVVFAVIGPLLGPAARAETPAVEVPPGFTDIAIAEVYGGPTDLAWLGDDLLIATQEGWLFRIAGDDPDQWPVEILDISERVGKGVEQGLLGVVPDPEFPARPYIYVYYTRPRDSGHCDVYPANCHNRVARFTMGADGLLDPASEVPLIDNLMVGLMHNAGDLAFDRQDLLYVTTGDASFWPNAQDLTNLNGKILRITRDGDPAPGNPFAGPESDVCGMGHDPDATAPCAEIFAYGLRNPFRIAFDPNRSDDRFYINDVGQDIWEEVDVGALGADYGWPILEGPCFTEMPDQCWTDTEFVAPIFVYSHWIGCFAITGGAFVPDRSPWGAAYNGAYLFADWGCGRIFLLRQDEDGRFSAATFASGLQTISPLLFSPDGRALYYGREGGVVHAIVPAGEDDATGRS